VLAIAIGAIAAPAAIGEKPNCCCRRIGSETIITIVHR